MRGIIRLGLWLAWAFAATSAPALAIPRPGDAAPPFALTATDGNALKSAALTGKPLYLNFFATWCGPCRVETPSIVALSRRYAARGLRVVGIDVGEDLGRARAFAKEFKVPYALAADPDSATRSTYGGGIYFPLHVFIDRHGVVRAYHPGEMNDAQIEAAIRAIVN
jgi:peroxiredoxin